MTTYINNVMWCPPHDGCPCQKCGAGWNTQYAELDLRSIGSPAQVEHGAVPEYRPRIPEMRAAGPEWAALADGWSEIEALLREEMPTGRAPRTYDRMREMIEGARHG